MSEPLMPASLAGVHIQGSPLVPEDQLLYIGGRIFFHRRMSLRGRKRRPHGRTNGPRRWKVRTVVYQPALDGLLAATDERAPHA